MTAPEADSLAVTLYNEIGRLDLFETERAKSLYLALRRLRDQQPSSFQISVALIMAMLKVGRREEALAEIDRSYGLKTTSDIISWGALADLNTFVGRFDRSAELYRQLFAIPGALSVPQISANSANSALIRGDMEALMNIANEDRKANQPVSNAISFLGIAAGHDMASTLGDHQRIVSSILRDLRTWAIPIIRFEDRAEPSIVIYHWVLADRPSRAILQADILTALRAHYQTIGADLSAALGAILNKIEQAPEMNVPMAIVA
jgi:hypothetical protein